MDSFAFLAQHGNRVYFPSETGESSGVEIRAVANAEARAVSIRAFIGGKVYTSAYEPTCASISDVLCAANVFSLAQGCGAINFAKYPDTRAYASAAHAAIVKFVVSEANAKYERIRMISPHIGKEIWPFVLFAEFEAYSVKR